ncbi:hypothetical protein EBR66_04085 [bacterium]|nr:hypothetical protein [bacterium]
MLRQAVLDGLTGLGAAMLLSMLWWWLRGISLADFIPFTFLHPASKIAMVCGAALGWYYQLSQYVA